SVGADFIAKNLNIPAFNALVNGEELFRDMLKNRLLKRDFCILRENAEARNRRIRLDTAMSDKAFAAKIQKS
ncbi:hypothetical protein HZC21_04925, partial [Candidatus Peregrinibacteria bacterium]|nr:hypothetical protein [Candidatus Peregrinibacteria bacterium]